MGDNERDHEDPIWNAAWAWVVQHHEEKYADPATAEALARWLAEDPRHRQAYERASRLWLLTGLVPPASDVDIPGCPKPDDD